MVEIGRPDRPLRIVYFGTPEFAVPTLEALLGSSHRVLAVVTQPDRPRGRGQHVTDAPVKALARARQLPVLQPERLKDQAFLDELRSLAPDLGVVAAYGKILPQGLLEIPRLGLVNVHASVLPKYRGAAPVNRAVMAGEPATGVTIMRIVQALDAGPVFATRPRPIAEDETSEDVERDLATIGAGLLVDVVDDLAAGRASETPQDDRVATYAPRLTRADGVVDWRRPARDIHNQVRGLHPWPRASTYLEGLRLVLHRTTVEPSCAPAEPGTAVRVGRDTLVVAAGDATALRVLSLQPEGKRVMSARDFLAGRLVAPGARFGTGPGL